MRLYFNACDRCGGTVQIVDLRVLNVGIEGSCVNCGRRWYDREPAKYEKRGARHGRMTVAA